MKECYNCVNYNAFKKCNKGYLLTKREGWCYNRDIWWHNFFKEEDNECSDFKHRIYDDPSGS